MPAIYALYVINKSGGLIYNKVASSFCSHNGHPILCALFR